MLDFCKYITKKENGLYLLGLKITGAISRAGMLLLKGWTILTKLHKPNYKALLSPASFAHSPPCCCP